jgi:hypothetical protein
MLLKGVDLVPPFLRYHIPINAAVRDSTEANVGRSGSSEVVIASGAEATIGDNLVEEKPPPRPQVLTYTNPVSAAFKYNSP